MIYAQMSKAMADLKAVGKNSKNQQQGFKFRGIDDVMNALHPIMSKHNIFVAPTVLDSNVKSYSTTRGTQMQNTVIKVEYSFYAEDGSKVTATTYGEASDSGDKSYSKAMSIAFKYALFQVFCIPTEEMQDPDLNSHERATTPQVSKEDRVTMWIEKTNDLEKLQEYGKKVYEVGDNKLTKLYEEKVKKLSTVIN